MITGKQRAYLRGLANTMTPIFQIGKNGVEETFLRRMAVGFDTVFTVLILSGVDFLLTNLSRLFIINIT